MRLFLEWWWLFLPVGFFLLLFCVTLWEKQPLHEYEPVGPEGISNPSPYFVEMNRQALANGLTFCGEFRQNRGSSAYACYVAFWLTADRTTLVRISGGKVVGVANRRTVLASWDCRDKAIESTDEFGTWDLGGTADMQVLVNADLGELLTFHSERRQSFSKDCRTFSEKEILQQHEALNLTKARRLVSLGYARFVDSTETVWRFTVKGALANYWFGYRTQKKSGIQQLDRVSRRRPGD